MLAALCISRPREKAARRAQVENWLSFRRATAVSPSDKTNKTYSLLHRLFCFFSLNSRRRALQPRHNQSMEVANTTADAFRAVNAAFSERIASYAPEMRSYPTEVITGVSFPRPSHGSSYMGVGLWNSRGASLMTAIRAMLGDSTAFVESPDFTLRRLQLQHGKGSSSLELALHRAITPPAAALIARDLDWGGYSRFMNETVPMVDAKGEALQLEDSSPPELKRHLQHLRERARGGDQAAAALLARVLMDVQSASRAARKQEVNNLVTNHNLETEEPEDWRVIWATVYPMIAAMWYGASTVVFDADATSRSADLPYMTRLQQFGYNLTADVPTPGRWFEIRRKRWFELYGPLEAGLVNNFHVWSGKWPNPDLGQLVYPAYVPPSDVGGFELRDPRATYRAVSWAVPGRRVPGEAPPGTQEALAATSGRIEIGFYKWRVGRQSVVLGVDLSHLEERHGCIVPLEPLPRPGEGSDRPPQLFACAPRKWDNFSVPALPSADLSKPLSVSVVLFVASPSESPEEQLAACNAARGLLQPKREGGSREASFRERWPRLAVAFDATRVDCDGHVLAASMGDTCTTLLVEWRAHVGHLAGRAPQVDERLGLEELDWQGDVPPSWLRLGPVPGCPAPPPLPPPSPSWLEWDEAAVLLIPPALFAVCGVALRLLRPGVADKPRGGSQGVRMARAMSTTVRAAPGTTGRPRHGWTGRV